MHIKKIKYYNFESLFEVPIHIKGHTLNTKKSIIISIEDELGNIACGDISPLPFYSTESFESVCENTGDLYGKIIGFATDISTDPIDVISSLKNFAFSSSVMFGLETALLNLIASRKKVNLYDFFGKEHYRYVKIAGLLTDLNSNSHKEISRMVNDGHKSVKIKLGRADIDFELKTLLMLLGFFHNKILFRLDVNGLWSFDEAVYFLNAIKSSDSIEFVEEPLLDYMEINRLHELFSIPFALDENLQNYLLLSGSTLNSISAGVIKPSVIGGISESLRLISLLNQNSKKIVISDSYSNGLGLAPLINLASACCESIPMGFDTYSNMKTDVLKKKFKVKNGKFDLRNICKYSKRINTAKFEGLTAF